MCCCSSLLLLALNAFLLFFKKLLMSALGYLRYIYIFLWRLCSLFLRVVCHVCLLFCS